ncbi:MAG: PAS domain-containing protein, partial [Candidatus Hydrothermarchaeales archaeon]
MKGQMVDWSETCEALEEEIVIIDTEYNILRANKTFAKMVGISQDGLAGRKCYEAVHGTDSPLSSCPLVKTLNTKKTASTEAKEPHLGKGTFLLTASPVIDDKREVKWVVLTIKDIT